MDEKLLTLYEECNLEWQERLDYIISKGFYFKSIDWLRGKIKKIRKKLGSSPWNWRNYDNNELKQLKQKIKTSSNISHTLKIEKERDKLKSEKKISDKKYRHLLEENKELNKKIEVAWNLGKHTKKSIITPSLWGSSESTPIICFSDYHYEETVEDFSVNWLNKYNVNIAKQRWSNFFRNSLKLIKMFWKDTNIKEVVLWLWWDLISGYLHEELEETNWLTPMEALLGVKEILKWWIDFLLENSNYDIIIPCSYWNHGRYHKKPRHSSGYKNNYEYLLYNIIAWEYKNNPRIRFQIAKSYFTYLDIYWHKLAFSHWDSVKFGWWVWWITIPINKAISQWRKSNLSDIFVMGHFHQVMFHKDFVVNGSIIWYNAFAQSIKAEYEKPCQAWFLINSKFWRTIDFRIYLD